MTAKKKVSKKKAANTKDKVAYRIGSAENPLPLFSEAKWFDFRGLKLKIDRYGNNYLTTLMALEENNKNRDDPLSQSQMVAYACAEAILTDWKDGEKAKIVDASGNKLDYSVASGYQAFQEDPYLLQFVMGTSKNDQNYINSKIEKGFIVKK